MGTETSTAGDPIKAAGRCNALDGLRFWAITLVVMSHLDILGQGGVGNGIFFALSGFLAAMPFRVDAEKKFVSVKYFATYYWNRLCRIIPVYWVVITVVKVITAGTFFPTRAEYFRNILFIESWGHLWFLRQLMIMYICLPFIMLFLAGVKWVCGHFTARGDIVCAVVLGGLSWLTNNKTFFINLFLMGMAAAYLFRGMSRFLEELGRRKWFSVASDVILFLLLIGCVLSSEPVLRRINPAFEGYYIGWQLTVPCTLAACFGIILLLANPKGLVARILGCKLFAALGQISFGIYLVHMFLIRYTNVTGNVRHFLFVYGLSVCVATVLYIFVEKPSAVLAKTRSLKAVFEYYRGL